MIVRQYIIIFIYADKIILKHVPKLSVYYVPFHNPCVGSLARKGTRKGKIEIKIDFQL